MTSIVLLLQLAVSTPTPITLPRPFLAAISVASVERSAEWYQRNLGFRIVRAPSTPRPGIGSALLGLDGFYLEIASLADSKPRASVLPIPGSNGSLQGVYKLAFWVSDFDATLAALAVAGVALYRPEGDRKSVV